MELHGRVSVVTFVVNKMKRHTLQVINETLHNHRVREVRPLVSGMIHHFTSRTFRVLINRTSFLIFRCVPGTSLGFLSLSFYNDRREPDIPSFFL